MEARALAKSVLLRAVLTELREQYLDKLLRESDLGLVIARREAVLTLDEIAETLHERIRRALAGDGEGAGG
jgi:ATP-dependent protease HslVU (ClpYQ) peptidase subunit